MKALRYLGPGRLSVEEVAQPEPQKGEALLKVRACGICGSDVHGALGLTGRRIPPMTMGHEFSAEVVESRGEGGEFRAGDGVIVQPINFCGECVNCRGGLTNMCPNRRFFGVLTVDGAMAEYVAVPEKLLYRLPEGCSHQVGALAEPYAVAHGAVKKIADFAGMNVLIVGAGPIGLCILQLVRLHNPKRIIVSDLSAARLEVARAFGADHTINPKQEDYLEAVARYTDGSMVDISVEAVGVQATANQSTKALKVGGTSIWVGMSQKEMEINMHDIVCSARRVLGSFNYTHEEFGEIVALLGSGRIDARRLISEVVSLEEAPRAFDDLHRRPDEFIKVIIDPTRR